jgi:hypothetical protein
LENIWEIYSSLPAGACPNGYVVFGWVMLPTRLGSKHFPRELFSLLNLHFAGSRKFSVHHPAVPTDEGVRNDNTFIIFVSCRREDLESAPAKLGTLKPGTVEAAELCNTQAAVHAKFSDRLQDIGESTVGHYIAAIHHLPNLAGSKMADAFLGYAGKCDFTSSGAGSVVTEGDVTFVQVQGERGGLIELCKFLPLLNIREAPRPRFSPAVGDGGSTSPGRLDDVSPSGGESEGRQTPEPGNMTFELPPPAEDRPYPRVAILDADLGNLDFLGAHVKDYEMASSEVGELPGLAGHGQGILTRYLFDELDENGKPKRAPLTRVSAVRVLDAGALKDDPLVLNHALVNIVTALSKNPYDIVILSLGPDVQARDGVVRLWTSVIDRLAYDHNILIIVAAGNNGKTDPASPAGRVEIPGDGFSTLTVGAGHREGDRLVRETFSACGPGCSIISVKPDLVCFGGNEDNPLSVLRVSPDLGVLHVMGTSYSPTLVANSAAALMIMGGRELTKCSVFSVLVHYADRMGADPKEVGWGLLPEFDPAGSPPETRCQIFQGMLSRDHFSRVEIKSVLEEIPAGADVKFKATFRFERKPDHTRLHERGLKSLVPRLVMNPSAAPDGTGYPPETHFFTRLDDGVHFHNLFSDSGKFAADDLRNAVIDMRYADPGNIHCLVPDVPFSLVLSAESVKSGQLPPAKAVGLELKGSSPG